MHRKSFGRIVRPIFGAATFRRTKHAMPRTHHDVVYSGTPHGNERHENDGKKKFGTKEKAKKTIVNFFFPYFRVEKWHTEKLDENTNNWINDLFVGKIRQYSAKWRLLHICICGKQRNGKTIWKDVTFSFRRLKVLFRGEFNLATASFFVRKFPLNCTGKLKLTGFEFVVNSSVHHSLRSMAHTEHAIQIDCIWTKWRDALDSASIPKQIER